MAQGSRSPETGQGLVIIIGLDDNSGAVADRLKIPNIFPGIVPSRTLASSSEAAVVLALQTEELTSGQTEMGGAGNIADHIKLLSMLAASIRQRS